MSLHERESQPGCRDAAAAEWVARCDAGLSEDERVEFERWRDAAPENRDAFNRLSSTWGSLGRPMRTGTAISLLDELEALQRRDRQRRMRAAAVAAVVGCAVVSAWWIQFRPASVNELPANTAVIVPERRTLSDGSTVEYARGTEWEIAFTDATRRVVLKRGDAHFQVTGNPARPFVVSVHGIDVHAVGTAFTVQAKETGVDVVVTEGRVAVDQESKGSLPRNLALLDQGSGVSVELASTATTDPSVTPVAPADFAARLSWRKPKLEFSGVALAEVVAVLNRYTSSQLVLGDPEIRGVLLSGLFRADDTESFLTTLENGFGIVAERRENQILLRKAK